MDGSNRDDLGAESARDIAIIGMACRFPGGADSPETFWEFLLAGGDGIVPIPADRWDKDAYFDADRSKKNRMYVDRGGFIAGLDQFDPLFFGISPAEAKQIDPQHRWLLEVTYEALENAGLKPSELRGTDTAVYIGQFMHDYEQVQLDASARGMVNSHSATGPSMTLTSNRISHAFDFRGPSMTLDTACSSSLVAVDLACKALRGGDCELAVAGGVNILLRPELTMAICKASMLSPEGHCKSFDREANGYVRSEGAGVVLLKRASAARRDGDRIWAIIKASAVNQDGHTVGITVPSGAAQEALLRRALARAGLAGSEIQYVEAHGTGTAVGDPIEVNALGAVLGRDRDGRDRCVLGSVKSNIGHLESAAGVAALIKTVLAMNHGVIPKNLHFNEANPKIDFERAKLRVASSAVPWLPGNDGARRALVNSFGFGGTNANVVLEHAPTPTTAARAEHGPGHVHVLVLSAKTEDGLRQLASKYVSRFPQDGEVDFAELCRSAATRREHHKHRLALLAVQWNAARAELEAFVGGRASASIVNGVASAFEPERLAFVFSGMGTQWPGMGRELHRTEPVFRAAFERCSDAFQAYTGWSLTERVLGVNSDANIDDTAVAQPGIFAVQVALAELLQSWGIVPSAVVGHSAGEVSAAYVAGALSFEDAITVAYHRSRLQAETEGLGTMLAIGLGEAAVAELLDGVEAKVSIAAINGEDAVTLAGDEAALSVIAARLEAQGTFARFLKVGIPYHSPVMDRILEPLVAALDGIRVQVPAIALYSTVSGALAKAADFSAEYWAQNVRRPVLFKAALESMTQAGMELFLEVAPHSALTPSIEKGIGVSSGKRAVTATLKRDQNDVVMLARTLAKLHVSGFPLDWRRRYPATGPGVALPNYAWQHASYWYEAEEAQRARLGNVSRHSGLKAAIHPLVGAPLNSTAPIWQSTVDLQDQVYLADHQLDGQPVFPAAAYVEMALVVAGERHGWTAVLLEDVAFNRLLFLDANEPTGMEIALGSDAASVVVSAFDSRSEEWSVHGRATIREGSSVAGRALELDAIRARCRSAFDRKRFYEHCQALGLSYQGEFQVVEAVYFEGDEVLTEIALSDALAATEGGHRLHPVLLDGAFQGLFATAECGYVPVRIAELYYYRRPSRRSLCHIRITERTASGIRGDVVIADLDGTIAVEVRGMASRATRNQTSSADNAAALLYGFRWEPSAASIARREAEVAGGTWILVADGQGVAERIARVLESRQQSVAVVSAESAFGAGALDGSSDDAAAGALLSIFEAHATSCRGVVYLAALDAPAVSASAGDAMLASCRAATVLPLWMAQALANVEWRTSPSVCLVSRAAHQMDVSEPPPEPAQGALWGFGRVFANEFPAHACTLVDLPSGLDGAAIDDFVTHLLDGEYEQELAFRSGARHVNRLRALSEPLLTEYSEIPSLPAAASPFRVAGTATSSGRRRFTLRAFAADTAGDDAVLLEVAQVTSGEGELEATLLAGEGSPPVPPVCGCAGVVTRIGRSTEPSDASLAVRFRAGDEVMGLASGLASIVEVPAMWLAHKPPNLSPEQAALVPTVWLSAHYALSRLASLRPGSRVLVYEAGKARGLAAIELARFWGATVFAAASSAEQRARLVETGVEHVFDSSSSTFLENILGATAGRGVDIVVALAGPRSEAKLVAALKPLGYFIELEPVAGTSAPPLLERLKTKSAAYRSVDVGVLAVEERELYGQLLRELAELFASGALTPLSVHSYHAAEVAAALTHLRSPQSCGLVGLGFAANGLRVAPGFAPQVVHARGTYLLTGGLGGLGLEVLEWLVAKGARSVVLVGRSEPSPSALDAIESARARGATVTTLRADVANATDLARVLSMIARDLPPLAGIVHAAGVLDDGMISQQSAPRFLRVMAPKVQGAWNLHEQTSHLELDFFVLFSSIASVVGWAGQSNYAAGNGFLDALARYRSALGKPALSINWGPWAGSGMAAKLDERSAQRMLEAGLSPLEAGSALGAMERLLSFHVPQAGVFEVDWSLLFRHDVDAQKKTVFLHLRRAAATPAARDLVSQLARLPESERAALLADEVSAVLAGVLGVEAGKSLDRAANVFDYGLNSLMAMDLLTRLQGLVERRLPATLVLKHPTVNALVEAIEEQLQREAAIASSEELYWEPQQPELVVGHERNGPLVTIGATVLQLIEENHTAHFNVGTMVEIDAGQFDLQALKIALNILFSYHDGCRLRLFADTAGWRQEIAPLGGGVDIAEHDLRGLGYEAGARRMLELNDALHRSLTFTRGDPLYRAAHYQLDGDTPHRFFLIFHHYVSDGWSQKLFSQQLASVYGKVLAREPVRLPAKAYTLKDWTERLHDFAYGPAVAEMPYWLEQIESARRAEIADEFVSDRPRRLDDYTSESASLDAADCAWLKDYCRNNNLELADLATYAIVKAFSRLTGTDALWVDLITHARSGIFPDVAIPDLFGQISESGAVLFELAAGASHVAQIATVRAQRLAVPHAGIGLRALRLINQSAAVRDKIKKHHAPQVGLNVDVTDYAEATKNSWVRFAREGIGTAQAAHLRKTADELRLAFFVAVRFYEGRLTLSVDYYRDRFRERTIQALVRAALAFMLEISGHELKPLPAPKSNPLAASRSDARAAASSI